MIRWAVRTRPVRRNGFTIVELMFVVAVIGVLATVAIPEFAEYLRRSKGSEARLQISAFERKLKIYFLTNTELPQGTSSQLPVPGVVGACPNRHPVSTAWDADPIWGALGFSIDEPSRENFVYAGLGNTAVLSVFFDHDCDGIVTGHMVVFDVNNGNLTATEIYNAFGPD